MTALLLAYQVPLLAPEQPPLSTAVVVHVRDVVPFCRRASEKLAVLASRFDVTVMV